MRIPIYMYLNRTMEQVESQWRNSIRHDKQLVPRLSTLEILLFVQKQTQAVGVMYGTEYKRHENEYERALTQMGWTLSHSFIAPTPHFKLEAV